MSRTKMMKVELVMMNLQILRVQQARAEASPKIEFLEKDLRLITIEDEKLKNLEISETTWKKMSGITSSETDMTKTTKKIAVEEPDLGLKDAPNLETKWDINPEKNTKLEANVKGAKTSKIILILTATEIIPTGTLQVAKAGMAMIEITEKVRMSRLIEKVRTCHRILETRPGLENTEKTLILTKIITVLPVAAVRLTRTTIANMTIITKIKASPLDTKITLTRMGIPEIGTQILGINLKKLERMNLLMKVTGIM